jgi:hypothetical protein
MSSIGGPGGIGGPKGPGGPTGPQGPGDLDEVGDVGDLGGIDAAQASKAAGQLEAMAAEIAAGKLTANEAIDRLVNEIAGSDQLGTTEQAELREMLTDLVANDPYLQSLVGRL